MAAALMVSCENNCWNIFGKDNNVDVVLKVTSPQMNSTRGEVSVLDSALGAIDNFNNNVEMWKEYDLRYILEIYEVVTSGTTTTTSEQPIYKRQVITTDDYDADGFNFKIQVVPNRTYKFVIWADFVVEGSKEDLFYDTTNLRAISRKADYVHRAMEEALDAYHISLTQEIKGAVTLDAELTRPMAKLRVVAIDYDEISSYSTLSKVDIKFDTEKNPVYRVFNAVSNSISDNCEAHEYNLSVDPAPYKAYTGTTEEGKEVSGFVLFSDYIFAERTINKGEKNEQPVSFSMAVYDKENTTEPIRTIDFDTQIPISRNYLTTIIGNCLTQKENIIVKINDTLLNHKDTLVEEEDYIVQ